MTSAQPFRRMGAPSVFSGCRKSVPAFIVIPSIGGPERIVAEISPPIPHFWPTFAWLPDGKWVVTDGLALLSTESGETRSLTSPPTKSVTLIFLPPSRQMGVPLRSAARLVSTSRIFTCST